MMFRRFVRFALCMALFGLLPVDDSRASTVDELGLGGSSMLTADTVLPFSPNSPTRYESSATLQNVGSLPLRVVLGATLPIGLTVEPLIEMPFVLEPEETRVVPFALVSGKSLVAGRYDAIVTLGTELDGPLPPGTTFLPGFSMGFKVNVIDGEPGQLTVRSVNKDDGKPAVGTISLLYIGPNGGGTLLETVEGSELTRTVPPGPYRADFSVEGLTSQSVNFEVAEGEDKEVVIEVEGISFIVVSAKPRGADGRVEAALLTMAVTNNLRRFVGPVKFVADVKRNGELVEQFQLTEFAELPEGLTEQQSTYLPPGGFRSGRWSFEFSLVAPGYTVRAAIIPEFEVPWRFAGFTLLTWLGLLAGIGAVLWFVLWRRRRDREEASA